MKKKLLLLLILAGIHFSLFASHYTGAEIGYKIVAPNTYEVNFKLYSECAGVAAPASVAIQITSPGCNTGRSITLNKVKQQIKYLTGPALPNGCITSIPANAIISSYSGLLTFSSAEQACIDWVLSWGECCRSSSGNLLGQADLYTEAHLKLLPGLLNSSPVFDTINYNFSSVQVNQPVLISALAQDAEGDSLVYTTVTPLSAANQPIPYTQFAGGGGGQGYIVNPNPLPPFNTTTNPQIAILPAGPNNYSPNFPLFSFQVNWASGASPIIAQPFFDVNPQTGNIAFHPGIYSPTNMPGQNRYVVSIQVDEYRKINGVATRIGSVRRETYIEVMNTNGNANPYLSQVEVNATSIAKGDIINLRPGVTMNLKLTASDADTTSTVLMASNVSGILPGAVFNQNGAKQPSGTIVWTPTINDVRDQPYYFNVVLKDDTNPLRGYHERTIGVRVSKTGSITGSKADFTFNADFTAYPNPFTDELKFKFNNQTKAESIIIYNILGRQVDQISVSKTVSGEQHVKWQNAAKHAAGMYVAKLIAADKTVQTLKFTKLQ